jgi:glycerophosphoryl diester phosphodiesterase
MGAGARDTMAAMGDLSCDFRLFGHRGAPAHAPENSMASFERALADGANALELDVHPTADGHFVVAHDADGVRTAGVSEKINETLLERIQQWNLGGAAERHRVPTLSEVLEAFPGIPMSIDHKQDDTAAVPALLEVIARHRAEQHVTLASFSSRVVRAIRRLGYPGPTTLSRPEVAMVKFLPTTLARRFIGGDAAHLPVRHGAFRLDHPRFVARCRRLGLRVEYWTIDDPAEARRLLGLGATGIMTDDPARIAPVFSEFGIQNFYPSTRLNPKDTKELMSRARR